MISFEIDNNSSKSLYVQLYEKIKGEISEGRISTGERLPSLRGMADSLGISVTTVKLAYDQLVAEGYLLSRPQSGYYAASVAGASAGTEPDGGSFEDSNSESKSGSEIRREPLSYDPETFDFVKWKRCMASVLNDSPEQLLIGADRQGEPALREEIAKYLYQSRGVICTQRQIVISAGTQQLTSHIARLLKLMAIGHVSVEDPGYMPVRSTFRDWGFSLSCIPVREDGIEIEKLPANIRTAVYVCPQNQFPTGALMPIGRRHRLLEWADDNDSIIIEDDYDSELRYFGMPVPALQGLDGGKRVIYIGSFTSTLFPAVRISYMVLPRDMISIYETMKMDYDQTCSKTEQLTLALFMQRGFYGANLRKIRNLYSHKLREAMDAIGEYGGKDGFASAENTRSGINIILRIDAGGGGDEKETSARLTDDAAGLGIKVRSIPQLSRDGMIYLIFYYNQIPAGEIRASVQKMLSAFRETVRGN